MQSQSYLPYPDINIMCYYWKGTSEQILLFSDGLNLHGIVFAKDNLFPIPNYYIRGFDKKALTSENAFKEFFNNTWLKINRDAEGLPISININGRLRGGSPESFLLSLALFAGGLFLTITTKKPSGLPLLMGAMLTGAGANGSIHAVTKPEEGFSKGYFKECAIGAVTSVMTSVANFGVQGVAKKIGEYTAKQTLEKIAFSAAKETAEEIALHAVTDLAKLGVQTTVAELQQQAIQEAGKRCAQSATANIFSGAVNGAVSKVSHLIAKEGTIPPIQKVAEEAVVGSITGGLSSVVNIAAFSSSEKTIATANDAFQKIKKDVAVGAVAGTTTSILSKAISNKMEGKPVEQNLKETGIMGASIGAASALIASTSASIMALNKQAENPTSHELINKQAGKFLNSIEELLKAKNYDEYLQIFSSHALLQQYVEAVFSKYIADNVANLTEEQVKQINNVKERFANQFFKNPEETEKLAEVVLGHLQNESGYSALSAGINEPNIINTGRIIVGENGSVFFNNKKLPVVSLEGNDIITSSDFQTMCMIEAYNQAPLDMKADFAKAVSVSLLRSELSYQMYNQNHQEVANAIIGNFKSGAMDTAALLTGFRGHAFQVTFILRGSLVYPIIDNYGAGAQFHPQITNTSGNTQYQPVQLAPFDISTPQGEQAFNQYLYNLSSTKYNPNRNESYDLIYKSRPFLSTPAPLPGVSLQDVGNCSLYNQQPATKRQLAESPGAYTHFMSIAKQLLKALRNAARSFPQQNVLSPVMAHVT